MEMEFENSKRIELTPEQMDQVAGGKVGDVFTGWTCWNCGSNMATAEVLREKLSIGFSTVTRTKNLYRHVGYKIHCDACGEAWFNDTVQNLGPAPADRTGN